MSRTLAARPLTVEAFAPFGDVLEADGDPDKVINDGRCGRFHDRARLDFGPEGRAGISVFLGETVAWPVEIALVERHPDGSQAFVSMTGHPFLVVVAPDEGGVPGTPRAFVAARGQGVNFHRGTWHGVLAPLHAPGLFAVVDRIGDSPNLEEHWFDFPYLVEAGAECADSVLAHES
ncbi:MAG: ureidoglycolate lyase [Boseongicola sp. SB0664_bin_43]|uniref:Ureidoglycolate lyase n=1 Tax=Boseongicola sp. SB0664_bin_43 TaxID=2604844 RepID=A0A6B0XXS8_9RHOB|nr:ureidoglycolate lyase [Boseongicola sp. SB0664_bin_43]MYK32496.1 ureidoglycolate lyase [Boseongicola sp. SB0670_bin_30]